MSTSRRTIEFLERVATDRDLLGELATDREARRRNKLDARKVRKLVDRIVRNSELVKLERRIALGSQRISRQKGLIARIERLGANSARARELLEVFETTQALFEQHRDRIVMTTRQQPR